MKKLTTLFKASLALMIMAMTAFAATAQDDVVTIEVGSTVEMKQGKTPKCLFVAPETGMLQITSDSDTRYAGVGGSTVLYRSLDENHGINPAEMTQDRRGNWTYFYEVTKGTSYYFFIDQLYTGGQSVVTFTFSMVADQDLNVYVKNVYPTPSTEKAFPINTNPELQVSFNLNGVTFEKVVLGYETASGAKATADLEYAKIDANEGDRFDVNIQQGIEPIKNSIKDGSNFTITFVKPNRNGKAVSGDYVENGDVVFTFLYYKITNCTKSVFPDPFLSYWAEDSKDGIIELEFDNELLPIEKQTVLEFHIFAGQQPDDMSGKFWEELEGAPIVIDGNVLTVDLRGVERVTKEKTVTIIMQNLFDIHGLNISFYGRDIIAQFDIPYQIAGATQLTYEFSPLPGGSLAEVNTLFMYLKNDAFDVLKINGFNFNCDNTDVPVALSDVKIYDDEYDPDFTVYEIPVPKQAQEAEYVVVNAVVESLDEYDYEISAIFENGEAGVEGIGMENGQAVIYNLQGVKVGNDLNALPAGIYISGGKKVLVGNR